MTMSLHQGSCVVPGKHSTEVEAFLKHLKGILKTLKDIKSIQKTLKASKNLKDTYITSPVVLLLIYLYV